MKKNLLVAFMLVVAGNTFANTAADTLVVTTQPQMHCQKAKYDDYVEAFKKIGYEIKKK